MADCNDIESLLDEIIKRLNSDRDRNPLGNNLEARVAKLERDNAFITRKNVEQDKEIFRIRLELARSGRSSSIEGRLSRAELQIKSQISFTAKLQNLFKAEQGVVRKLRNDFTFLTKRFSEENLKRDNKFKELDSKNTKQDEKITVIDRQLTAIKVALAALTGAGGVLAVFTAKLAALVAKQAATDLAIEGIKRLAQQRGQKGDKGDRGEKGDRGNDGTRGQNGERGQQGQKGDKGDRGEKGERGEKGLKGEKGDKGERGEKGLKGDDGNQGEKGLKGDKGDRGEKGERGQQGVKGERGQQGEKGEEGQVKVVETIKIVEKPKIIETTKLVEKIKEVEVTKLVYKEPNLREVLQRIGELRGKLIFNSSVQIPENCSQGQSQSTNDLPSFLNSLEDKLTGMQSLICRNPDLETANIKKFVKCSLEGEPEFVFEDIQVIKGTKIQTEMMFANVADIEALQCLETEVVAAIPEAWGVRIEADRPQLVILFAEILPNNKYGRSRYPLSLPHYNGTKGNKPVIPDYQKGQIEGKLILKDNSKIIVNAISEDEATRVINSLKPYVKGQMLVNDRIQFTNRKGQDLKQINVRARTASFFETGQKNAVPTYRIKFD